jgi:hypothetical protein
MRFSHFLTAIFLIACICISTQSSAQVVGGRKKEHRNQKARGKLFGPKSRGNASAFARGSHRGIVARIFKKKKNGGAWVYHKTNPGKKQNREQPKLFSRNRTKGKRFTDGIIAQQNKQRNANRVRGSASFTKRKH